MGIEAAIIGSAIIGAGSSMIASDKAADATKRASDASVAEQRRQFDLYRGDLEPYREAGYGALNRLTRLSQGDFSDFYESPGYQFNLREGQKAIDRSLAARGRALSGAGVREGMRYASGLASNEFANYWNRQAGLASGGAGAVQQAGTAGMNMAGNIGNYLTNAGTARANAYLTAGQGLNNAVQGGVSNYLLHDYLSRSPTGAMG